MILSNFTSKLNWRLIVIHLIACGFFIYSFMMFSYLHDHKFLMSILNHPKDWFKQPENRPVFPNTLGMDLLWINLSKPIGLLIGFSISLAITIKKHWYWVNSFVVFLLGVLLLRYNLFGWDCLKHILLAPGSLFADYTIGYFLVNGLIMLIIGLVLFFLRWLVQFINPSTDSERLDEAMLQGNDPQSSSINP